jgi:hypothetical protein
MQNFGGDTLLKSARLKDTVGGYIVKMDLTEIVVRMGGGPWLRTLSSGVLQCWPCETVGGSATTVVNSKVTASS